jgi:hypothetical protein
MFALVAALGSGDTPVRGLFRVDGRRLGEAVQVDPFKLMLKPPGTKRLKLNCDELLSTSAFKLKLRRYTWATLRTFAPA